jgi:quinol monooxygenase YgiN
MKNTIFLFLASLFLGSCQHQDAQNNVQEGEIIDSTKAMSDTIVETPDKNLVLVELKVREGEDENVFELLDSEMGLPHTRAYDGCLSLEMVYNEEAKTVLILSNWESYDKYGAYFKWRREVDTTMAALMPLLQEETPMVVYTPNSGYRSY